MTAPAGVAGNTLTLAWSRDGGSYSDFAVLTSTAGLDDTGGRTVILPEGIAGAQTFSITGTFTFNFDATAQGGALRLFQADGSGDDAARFGLTIGVQPSIPENSTTGIIVGAVVLGIVALCRLGKQRQA